MNAFKEGLKLGFMFQFIIGPICFFLLQVSIKDGFIVALWGSIGVSIGDGIFIILAILGLGTIFEKFQKLKQISCFIGMLILSLYGLYIIFGALMQDFGTKETLKVSLHSFKALFYGLIITLSNPITILYWSSSFAINLASRKEKGSKKEIYLLGFGAFITTPIFLIVWVGFGAYFGKLIPQSFMPYIQGSIGVLLIYYGIKTYLKVRK
ncbi:MAG: LysE family transporter [Helicobacteraceae bacterium]|nr:LysE family transporter [Helicobacteraceae bacterium]